MRAQPEIEVGEKLLECIGVADGDARITDSVMTDVGQIPNGGYVRQSSRIQRQDKVERGAVSQHTDEDLRPLAGAGCADIFPTISEVALAGYVVQTWVPDAKSIVEFGKECPRCRVHFVCEAREVLKAEV